MMHNQYFSVHLILSIPANLNFYIACRTAKEKRKAKADARRDAQRKLAKRAETGWADVDVKTQSWDYDEVPRSHQWAIPKHRTRNTKLQIFLQFVNPSLLTAIFNSHDPTHWEHKSSKKYRDRTYEFYRNLWPEGKFNLVNC